MTHPPGRAATFAAEALFTAIAEDFGTPVDDLRATYRAVMENEPDQLARIVALLNRQSIIAAGQAQHLLYLYDRVAAGESSPAD